MTGRDIDQKIDVLFRDEHIAIVNKPAGLMMHDSALARGEHDFVADRLRAQFGQKIFLAHRLDRPTSGCLLLAFDRDTAAHLNAQFQTRVIEKEYLALCRGWPDEKMSVDYELDGGPGKPIKKPALTHFETLQRFEIDLPSAGFPTSRYALLKCKPETGRFRQIRRHLHHIDHHLIGDTSHGDGRRNRDFRMHGIHRMMLHARTLRFLHPTTDAPLEVQADTDAEWQRAIIWLESAVTKTSLCRKDIT